MAKKKATREPQNSSWTGGTGTGKSTACKQFCDKYLKGRPTLVITFTNKHKVWKDIPKTTATEKGLSFKKGWKHIIYAKEEYPPIPEIVKYFRNGTVIFDDCRYYIKPNWEHTEGLKEIVIDHRPMGLDLFFVAHDPTQIPPNVWPFLHWSVIFRTTKIFNQGKVPIGQFDHFLTLQKQVNKQYLKTYRQKGKAYGIYKAIQL